MTKSVKPLPVSLSSFTAVHTTGGTLLNWTTESELNNAGFIVEPIITYTPIGEESGIEVPSYSGREAGHGFPKM